MTQSSQKLNVKCMRSFKVLNVIGEEKLAFMLKLSVQMRVHSVFHMSLLKLYRESILPERVQEPFLSMKVEGELEYKMKKILDSRIE